MRAARGRPAVKAISRCIDRRSTSRSQQVVGLGHERVPQHLHTYRISALSLWNAASAGLSPAEVEAALALYSRYEIPRDISFIVRDTMARFGRLVLKEIPSELPDRLFLSCADGEAEREIASSKKLQKWLVPAPGGFELRLTERGTVKRELFKLGWPVKDEAPLTPGDPLTIALRDSRASGGPSAFGIPNGRPRSLRRRRASRLGLRRRRHALRRRQDHRRDGGDGGDRP